MAGSFIFALGIIVFGMLLGFGLRVVLDKGWIESPNKMHRILKLFTMTALLIVNPIIILGAFWIVDLGDARLIWIPLMGGLTITLGGGLALIAAKRLNYGRKQQGAMFSSGTFTNLGSFGALFCFVFLGEASLAYVAMFRLLEDLLYYAVGFPVAKSFGESRKGKEKAKTMSASSSETGLTSAPFLVKKIVQNPFIVVTLLAISAGGLLNFSAWERPVIYSDLNSVLVPIFTILLVVPTGFNLRVSKSKNYMKESLVIASIKFGIVPVTITLFALLFGLREIHDGVVLKTLLILAAMPPGFTSMVPPQMFHLDTDLANSTWFINTLLLFFVLPVLYFLVLVL